MNYSRKKSKEYWAIVEEKPPLEEEQLINWLKNQDKIDREPMKKK